MSNDVVIRVENLSKLYRLGELHKQANSFREKATNSFKRLWNRDKSESVPQALRSKHNSLTLSLKNTNKNHTFYVLFFDSKSGIKRMFF